MPNDIDLSTEALLKHRAIAEKATPGPWIEVTLPDDDFDYDSTFVTTETRDKISKVEIAKVEYTEPWNKKPNEFTIEQRANAAHIAANSPDVVMAHIDEILRLRNELAATESREGEGDAYVEQLCLERDDLEAQAVRLEREAEWLAHNARKGCPPVPPERLPDCDNEEHPHDCASCWREAARKAVEGKCQK